MTSTTMEPLLTEIIKDIPNIDNPSGSRKMTTHQAGKQKCEKFSKPPRKRSRIACTWCRDRKVRCDASSHGVPCTNCELDQQECAINSTSQFHNNILMEISPITCKPARNTRTKKTAYARRQPYPSPTPSVLKTSVFQPAETSPDSPLISHTWADDEAQSNWDVPPASRSSLLSSNHIQPNSNVFYSFYSFLKLPGLSQVPQDDVEYLNMKDCLRVPSGSTLDEFVRKYFLYVHPCLPLINEADFWRMYYNQPMPLGKESNISLFTFQAMLFASCAFVSSKAIKSAGFTDTRTARNTLYNRAKLLYDLGCEKDVLATAQGALLLTYQSSSNELHAGSLWLSVAIQNAVTYGAHVPDNWGHSGDKDHYGDTGKRLWWSILLRDRILSLGLRRHPQVTPRNFDLSLNPMTEEDLEDEISHSEVYDSETKQLLARVLRIQCELCMTFTDIIMLVYTPNGLGQLKTKLDPEFSQTIRRIADCRASLMKWSTGAKSALGSVVNSHVAHESVALYFGLTFLYYHAARLALCHFEALTLEIHKERTDDLPSSLFERIQDELEDATGCITDTIKRFLAQGVAHHLPISTVAFTALPLLLSALDVKLSTTKSQTATRKRRFRYYANVMQLYQHRYDGTDSVAMFIQKTLQLADEINIAGFPQEKREGKKPLVSCSWSELFSQSPRRYLRLSLALDHAFSRGYFPENTGFHELIGGLVDVDVKGYMHSHPHPSFEVPAPRNLGLEPTGYHTLLESCRMREPLLPYQQHQHMSSTATPIDLVHQEPNPHFHDPTLTSYNNPSIEAHYQPQATFPDQSCSMYTIIQPQDSMDACHEFLNFGPSVSEPYTGLMPLATVEEGICSNG